MKTIYLIALTCWLSACGTTTKVLSSGTVALNSDVRGQKMAPIAMVYKFNRLNDRHEIFFFDEDKNRYNLMVDGKIDTSQGVLFYLPAGKRYALASFLHVHTWGREEITFGDDIPMFEVRPDQLTQLAYFEISPTPNNGIAVSKTPANAQDPFQIRVRMRFDYKGPIRAVQALEPRNLTSK